MTGELGEPQVTTGRVISDGMANVSAGEHLQNSQVTGHTIIMINNIF